MLVIKHSPADCTSLPKLTTFTFQLVMFSEISTVCRSVATSSFAISARFRARRAVPESMSAVSCAFAATAAHKSHYVNTRRDWENTSRTNPYTGKSVSFKMRTARARLLSCELKSLQFLWACCSKESALLSVGNGLLCGRGSFV
jgi:hypothetical protein